MRSDRVLLGAIVGWSVLVGAGFAGLLIYKSTPGRAASAPVRWPARSSLHHAGDEPTLVMMIHPRCPCTRASLDELNSLASTRTFKTYIVVVSPPGVSRGWDETPTVRRAREIPGATVIRHPGGREASLF